MNLAAQRPGFWRAALVSAGTGLLFMTLYHACNAYAANCGRLRTWCMDWELGIPVVSWLIVPYWSIDLLFAIAPFLCTRRSELRILAGRVSLATLLAAICFVVWPLQCMHERTDEHGIFTPLFAAIHSFDRPHNLFPSLHVAFAFILRWTYHRHLRGLPRLLFHAWFACITVSTVLVHQHHLVDVAGGVVLAILCSYLISEETASPCRVPVERRGLALALWHLGGAGLCLALARWLGSWAWILIWPALSLSLIGVAHLGPGSAIFRKRAHGLSWAAWAVLWPYMAGLTWSRRWWWRRDPSGAAMIADGVWVGRLPDADMIRRFGIRGILDLTAEHDGPRSSSDLAIERLPLLDLVVPTTSQLQAAVAAVERLRVHGPVLIHCALGYGRSATVAAVWLYATGRAADPEAAAALVRTARPGARVSVAALARFPIPSPAAT